MLQPTLITWILVIFGALFIFLPTLYAQLLMELRPHSQEAKDFHRQRRGLAHVSSLAKDGIILAITLQTILRLPSGLASVLSQATLGQVGDRRGKKLDRREPITP